MLSSMTSHWWIPALRGSLAVLFGIAAFVYPGITLATLVLLFGAYALADGIMTLVQGLRSAGSRDHWLLTVLSGLLGIGAGVLAFVGPGLTALSLVYVMAVWAVLTGSLQIATAVRMRDVISNEWLVGIGGALSILFGIIVISSPGAGALTLVFLFGFYAISAGLSQISFGLHLRRVGEHLPRRQTATSAAH